MAWRPPMGFQERKSHSPAERVDRLFEDVLVQIERVVWERRLTARHPASHFSHPSRASVVSLLGHPDGGQPVPFCLKSMFLKLSWTGEKKRG